ncbi:hypothetical protein GQ53DRAFT_876871 [Thozetella sp. PMI_491]|nr:hypothetical protein GQ53DRAFT_876871 [Thozetella sp. PMI_491]
MKCNTFRILARYEYQHSAAADLRKVYRYRFDDKPMLSSLGFYRPAGRDVEYLVTIVVICS